MAHVVETARPICRVPMFAKAFYTTPQIPPMTNPLGRHWKQPDPSNFEITTTHAYMTRREFAALAEYSTTTPSGVYEGKCWKAEGMEWPENSHGVLGFPKSTGIWYLRWFGESDRPNCVSNNCRIIVITD